MEDVPSRPSATSTANAWAALFAVPLYGFGFVLPEIVLKKYGSWRWADWFYAFKDPATVFLFSVLLLTGWVLCNRHGDPARGGVRPLTPLQGLRLFLTGVMIIPVGLVLLEVISIGLLAVRPLDW